VATPRVCLDHEFEIEALEGGTTPTPSSIGINRKDIMVVIGFSACRYIVWPDMDFLYLAYSILFNNLLICKERDGVEQLS